MDEQAVAEQVGRARGHDAAVGSGVRGVGLRSETLSLRSCSDKGSTFSAAMQRQQQGVAIKTRQHRSSVSMCWK